MQNRKNILVLPTLFLTFSLLAACVNPPQRASGVNPNPANPGDGGKPDNPPPPDGVQPPRAGDGSIRPAPAVVPVPVTEAGSVKVSYWLNATVNSNCVIIQPPNNLAPISSPCSGDGRTTPQWIDSNVAFSGTSAFKPIVTIETTDKAGNKLSSASNNLGDNAWRWRCISKQDKVTKAFVHTLCYEDGDALTLNKSFDSSDLFVQFVGPEKIDLGGVQCTLVTDVDLAKCSGK